MTRTTKILMICYGLIVSLFLLDCLASFDNKSQGLKTFVYCGILLGTPIMLIWNFFVIKTKTKRIIGTVIPTIFLIMIFIIGPLKFVFSMGAWQTQTILYKHEQLIFKTIEYQMQDVGALGYNQRTVEVTYITPLFIITEECDLT